MISADATASRLSARQRVTAAIYQRNGTEVTAGQMARALELAVAWAVAADERHITLADLAGASGDLATVALDAVLNHDQRVADRVVTP